MFVTYWGGNKQLWETGKKLKGKPALVIEQSLRGSAVISVFILMMMMLSGRRPDEEGVEDNGLEEDSGDGQVQGAGFEGAGDRWLSSHPDCDICFFLSFRRMILKRVSIPCRILT